LTETQPGNPKALAPRLSLIYNSPEAFLYGALLSYGCQIWNRNVVSESTAPYPNIWDAFHPLCLFAFAAASYVPEDEETFARRLVRRSGQNDVSDISFLLRYTHPFIVFNDLCTAAARNWYAGDWDDFDGVWHWANNICERVTQVKLSAMMARLRISIMRAISESKGVYKARRYPLEAGLQSVELMINEPIAILSPQKLLRPVFEGEYPPRVCEGSGRRDAFGCAQAVGFALQMTILERIVSGGRVHCGALSKDDCADSQWCICNEFPSMRKPEFEECAAVFDALIGGMHTLWPSSA